MLMTSRSSMSSTASVTSSILEYRTIQGRTYNSDRHNANFFAPNDERQAESVDIREAVLLLGIDSGSYLTVWQPSPPDTTAG